MRYLNHRRMTNAGAGRLRLAVRLRQRLQEIFGQPAVAAPTAASRPHQRDVGEYTDRPSAGSVPCDIGGGRWDRDDDNMCAATGFSREGRSSVDDARPFESLRTPTVS
jgi:hypothetical protein